MKTDPWGPAQRLDRERAQLVVIDVQARLVPHIHDHSGVVEQCARMLRAAELLGLPVSVSEQYPSGLGPTIEPLLQLCQRAERALKMTFSLCDDAVALRRLTSLERPQVLMIGIETHVCVLQTALDLLRTGMTPVVLADAVGSRRAFERDVALERIRAAGAVVTTVESAVFELTRRCDTEVFRSILKIVK